MGEFGGFENMRRAKEEYDFSRARRGG